MWQTDDRETDHVTEKCVAVDEIAGAIDSVLKLSFIRSLHKFNLRLNYLLNLLSQIHMLSTDFTVGYILHVLQ